VFISITDTKITAVLAAIDLAPFEVGDLGYATTWRARIRTHLPAPRKFEIEQSF
jgi:hypothetical protein